MKLFTRFFVFVFLAFCSSKIEAKSFEFIFSRSNENFQGDFSDFPVDGESFLELAWGWQNLPNPSQTLTKGIFLSGNNHSDDLFMFVRRQINCLRPNTWYDLFFNVTIQNNVPPGQGGIGGSPGEGVFFKVGASRQKPKRIILDPNADFPVYVLNVDKGDQSQGGKNAIVVGDLANPAVDPNQPTFEFKSFSNECALRAKTDRQGRLWIFVGTDSGFEGTTLYYIAKISVDARLAR